MPSAAFADCNSYPVQAGGTIEGTPCADVIVAPPGVTTIDSGGGSDSIVAGPDVTSISSGSGADTIYSTEAVSEVDAGPGNDLIYGETPGIAADPSAALPEGVVPMIDGGEGDDLIYGELPRASEAVTRLEWRRHHRGATAIASNVVNCSAGVSCLGGLGNQEMYGSGGKDIIVGERGNDKLYGGDEDDKLYGGIGDDDLYGDERRDGSKGSGSDLLSGGLGGDYLDGQNASDTTRGDMTADNTIKDTGGSGTDTLSFATAVTPGFGGNPTIDGTPLSAKAPSFPPHQNADSTYGERGVYLDLRTANTQADNGGARYGGGDDTANLFPGGFENVVGSAFSDVLIGNSYDNKIDGGGGADLILGQGGDDNLFGGQDGDYLEGNSGTDKFHGEWGTNYCLSETGETELFGCNGSTPDVSLRASGTISVGIMATSSPSYVDARDFYLTGSSANDAVTATYDSASRTVTFSTTSGTFDTSANDNPSADCPTFAGTSVTCKVGSSPAFLDAIVLAGRAGSDSLAMSSFPDTASPVLLGGEGGDSNLSGGGVTEDLLVDGPGASNDSLTAWGRDDALLNNEGDDNLQGGNGNDLLLSAVLCGGDTLQGAASGAGDGSDKNNASWFQSDIGVFANLSPVNGGDRAGNAADANGPTCTAGTTDTLANIDDLEGSPQGDTLVGEKNVNLILGHQAADVMKSLGADDNIDAQDKTADTTVDCGESVNDNDTANVDGSDSPSHCENVQ
ncbi:MAG: calcium-binding protein [Solirubrobacterales bacterium]